MAISVASRRRMPFVRAQALCDRYGESRDPHAEGQPVDQDSIELNRIYKGWPRITVAGLLSFQGKRKTKQEKTDGVGWSGTAAGL